MFRQNSEPPRNPPGKKTCYGNESTHNRQISSPHSSQMALGIWQTRNSQIESFNNKNSLLNNSHFTNATFEKYLRNVDVFSIILHNKRSDLIAYKFIYKYQCQKPYVIIKITCQHDVNNNKRSSKQKSY